MLLVCSAFDKELIGLNLSIDHDRALLGIGFLEAAINLETIVNKKKYQKIIFIGTAGSYSKNYSIGDSVSVSETRLLLRKDAHIPKPYPIYKLELIDNLKSAICFSSLDISLNQSLCHANDSVENMELYGVAKIADKYQISCSAILGITNYANANAHQDWLSNNEKVSIQTCHIANNFIK
jgi:nucleoside phosphorylase